MTPTARTLGDLRRDPTWSTHLERVPSVKDEIRRNVIARLRSGEPLFPGIHGYDETVLPQIVNALLAKQNFILLGLRGQAKSRILRQIVHLLDEWVPVVEGCEIHDHPLRPICRRCRQLKQEAGDETPIAFLHREQRYVEKLATPDVTVADLIGDIDPIRAARGGHVLADELVIHFGLLPRAHRGIFAMNELPDLAPKVQVALFNVMQEGDVPLKGFPVRRPLDVLLIVTATPEDYTARGKIITPLKDRIGAEVRTHYPPDRRTGIAITRQEAWWQRPTDRPLEVPEFILEVIEEVAFQARKDGRIDQRSGVSQRLPIAALELAVSNAEQRAYRTGEPWVVPRIVDVYAAIPAMTGKMELEYEGELKGAESVAESLIRQAIAQVFRQYYAEDEFRALVEWFEDGGTLIIPEWAPTAHILPVLRRVPQLLEKADRLAKKTQHADAVRVSAAELILDGLWAHKRISRHPEQGYTRAEAHVPTRPAGPPRRVN
ncbi:MAG: sigma 54-interacting transcriptional regulator [Acidobacteria bacterium]|nr:sigma 54-interacting transcriptional regulator [Acidobacteriota bacterium]MDW7984699.1 sigma 54-interacting transcriptional regulator [Acidobacteriota bacterium]